MRALDVSKRTTLVSMSIPAHEPGNAVLSCHPGDGAAVPDPSLALPRVQLVQDFRTLGGLRMKETWSDTSQHILSLQRQLKCRRTDGWIGG